MSDTIETLRRNSELSDQMRVVDPFENTEKAFQRFGATDIFQLERAWPNERIENLSNLLFFQRKKNPKTAGHLLGQRYYKNEQEELDPFQLQTDLYRALGITAGELAFMTRVELDPAYGPIFFNSLLTVSRLNEATYHNAQKYETQFYAGKPLDKTQQNVLIKRADILMRHLYFGAEEPLDTVDIIKAFKGTAKKIPYSTRREILTGYSKALAEPRE